MRRSKSNKKIVFISFLYSLIMALIVINVFFVSVLNIHPLSGTNIKIFADNRTVVNEEIIAKRGNIYDSDGNLIAQDIDAFNIICILSKDRPGLDGKPAYVVDVYETAKQLSPIIKMSEDEILFYLTKDVYQTELGTKGRNLSKKQKDEIEALGLPGIEFEKTTTRFYPNGEFASHLIGFGQFNATENKIKGAIGIELYYDDYLLGENGYRQYQKDGNGFSIPGTVDVQKEAINGNNVYLTINSKVQNYLEVGMKQLVEEFNPKMAWAIVMEVKTGKILGYSSVPTFDPNLKNIEDFIDPISQYNYEAGSTFKPFLYAAAINEGVYDGNATYKSGKFYVSTDSQGNPKEGTSSNNIGIVYDFNRSGWGEITYDVGLQRSSNTAVANLLVKYVGADVYEKYLDAFGFFRKVNFEASDEAEGKKNYNYAFDKIATTFGQSSSTTTLQLMQAYSAIFGNGSMVKPYVIDRIVDSYSGEVIYKGKTEIVGSPIKSETAQHVRDLLYNVVYGSPASAIKYRLSDYNIIGKTGTAEIVGEDGKYMTGAKNYLYSFISAAPYEDPEVMIYYVINQYQNNVANPPANTKIFNSMYRNILKELNIKTINQEEDTEEDNNLVSTAQRFELKNFINHSKSYAISQLEENTNNYLIIGNGTNIVNQRPIGNQTISNMQPVFLLTDGDYIQMPNMIGWSLKQVSQFWDLTGIRIKTEGFGYVISQNIAENTKIDKESLIELMLN